MSTLSYYSIIAMCILAAFISGFFYGRNMFEKSILKQTVLAYENRKSVEDEVSTYTPYNLCLALGGLSNNCSALLRGVDESSQNSKPTQSGEK